MPLDSTAYMIVVILTAVVIALVSSFNLSGLRRKSSNVCAIIAVSVLTVAILMVVVFLPATSSRNRWTIFPATAAMIELMLVIVSLILAGIALYQFWSGERFRRGRKRAIACIIIDLAFGGFLIYRLEQYQDEAAKAMAERRSFGQMPEAAAPADSARDKRPTKPLATPPPLLPGAHEDAE